MVRSTSSQSLEGQDSTPTSTLLPAISLGDNDTLVESDERRSHLLLFSPTLFLLTFLVVLVSAGLGVTMICWFVVHTLQGEFMDIWREGAFLLDEGTQSEGDFEAARLAGLTISSAAVSSALTAFSQRSNDEQTIAMNTAMPILLSLYAYRVSYAWMKSTKEDSPTPLQ